MSLINQMLRDLDARRGPVNETDVVALQGMGLARARPMKRHQHRYLAAWGLLVPLTLALAYQAMGWWNSTAEVEAVSRLNDLAATTPADPSVSVVLLSGGNDTVTAQQATAPQQTEASQETEATPVATPAQASSTVAQAEAQAVVTPVRVLTPEDKAERLYRTARLALSRQEQERGEQLLWQALAEHSGHIGARGQLANLLLSRQEYDRAELLLAEGLVTDAHRLALARPYAQLLAAKGELVPALETLDRATGQGRTDPETSALRAAILYRLGRHSESADAYRKALRSQPRRAIWWTGLGVALEQSGAPRAALDAFQRASSLPLEKAVSDYVKQRIQVLRDTEFQH
jgi:tetratricopeptide (TPR) repeat protein